MDLRRHLPLLLVVPAVLVIGGAHEVGKTFDAEARHPQSVVAPVHVPPLVEPRAAFDLSDPEVGNLDPELLRAVSAAARDARAAGVPFRITSGWRSASHQQRLLDEAIQRYGSAQEASRFVSTPEKSAHVTGDAVDVGPEAADRWLIEHGSAYGLCQMFANEIWHFELATEPGTPCPAPLPDSSYR